MYDLNDSQLAAVQTIDGPVLVTAGAGTGKTKVLCSRLLYMLEKGIQPERILCLTFSNQAANEMINRIDNKQIWVGTFHGICFRILQMVGKINNQTTIIDEYDQKSLCNKLGILPYMQQIKVYLESMEMLPANLQSYYDTYLEYINENNLIDFHNLIENTIDYFKDNRCEFFDYIMVDEYQDTNLLQETLITCLVQNQKSPNLFCVGDDDQCIYQWRGANIENIIKFTQRYPDTKVFKLEYNYRSTKQILNNAFSVIKHNKNRLPKQVWSDREGDPVQVICSNKENQVIVDQINKMQGNVGILVRSSKQISTIEVDLVKAKINYQIIGGNKFFNKSEIKHLIYYLNVIINKDIFALLNIINYPKRGLGKKKIELLEENLKTMEYFQAIKSVHMPIGEFMENLHNSKQFNVAMIDKIIEFSNMKDILTDDQINNINVFKSNLTDEMLKSVNNLQLEIVGHNNINSTKVTLLTIHASKGLEFDNVIIPNFMEGVLPNSIAIGQGTVDEERRLCYVAMTRAKNNLLITYTMKSNSFKFFGPSRFLRNLSQKDIKFQLAS